MNVQDYNILELIPQQPPFVMVDRVISFTKDRVITAFKITDDNILCIGGEFQEAGLIENIAQSAAAMEGCYAKNNNQDVRIGFIGSVKSLIVNRNALTGEMLTTSVEVINQVMGVNIVKGEVRHNNELLVQCELNIFLQES